MLRYFSRRSAPPDIFINTPSFSYFELDSYEPVVTQLIFDLYKCVSFDVW